MIVNVRLGHLRSNVFPKSAVVLARKSNFTQTNPSAAVGQIAGIPSELV